MRFYYWLSTIVLFVFKLNTNLIVAQSADFNAQQGDIRLIGGYLETEGTVIVYHGYRWGLVCDDLWSLKNAGIVCRQLGFGAAMERYAGNHFQTSATLYPDIWMDQVECNGSESRLDQCRRSPWGVHDCKPSEAAGVRCSSYSKRKNKPRWNPLGLQNMNRTEIQAYTNKRFDLRYVQKRTDGSGLIIVKIGEVEGAICPEDFTTAEAAVICRHLGMGFAAAKRHFPLHNETELSNKTLRSEYNFNVSRVRHHVLRLGRCRGNESTVNQCGVVYASENGVQCLSKKSRYSASWKYAVGVRCTRAQADLVPDATALEHSVYLQEIPMYYLVCSMEENCLGPAAYRIKDRDPYWITRTRLLLRFSGIIANEGTADFLPFEPRDTWQWHACHQHYHSMSVFATYEVFRPGGTESDGETFAAGHKASFCLEDNVCPSDSMKRFRCSDNPHDKGTQGISPGCKDVYLHDLDCQWVDVTDLAIGEYMFRVIINPHFKVAESKFENNAVLCRLYFTGYSATLHDCQNVHPFEALGYHTI